MIFRRHVIPGAHKSPSIAKKMGTAAASVLLTKQLTQRWNFQFHGSGAVGIVILDLVDPCAHRVPTHRAPCTARAAAMRFSYFVPSD
jgi:hypothetical protein